MTTIHDMRNALNNYTDERDNGTPDGVARAANTLAHSVNGYLEGLQPVTITHHDLPTTTAGGVAAQVSVVCGRVLGELIRSQWFDDGEPQIGWDVHMHIDGHRGLGLANVEADEPAMLRSLATVAGVLADELAAAARAGGGRR